jgi:hypothetical protein
MMFNSNAVTTALSSSSNNNENYCPPSLVATKLYESIPENIRALFRAPRGVQDKEGNYVGSILQVAKGTMGRLHGPALEILAYQMLERIVTLDERTEQERLDPDCDPSIIKFQDQLVKWDVRRYSSSLVKGRWQTIPDMSYYLDCDQKQMRKALADNREENSNEEQGSSQQSSNNNNRYTQGF